MPRIPEVDKQERIERTYQLLARGKRPAQITEAISKKYGCSRMTVRKCYLPRAREMMLQQVKEDKRVMRSRSLAFYLSMLEDAEVADRDKIKAQERIDKLLVLEESPPIIGQQVNVFGSDGDDSARDRVLDRLNRELKKRGIGGGNGESTGT